ncbi:MULTISPECIES: hypothetical protein [unclassified Rhizobium]|uniref:hypothetical protein n=1 Tax=unclassified Rhizobium TaxID=2613769 RepID=UPI0012E36C5A|nr:MULTISPECIES: hypothetical protein [unclassified Rhizobium]
MKYTIYFPLDQIPCRVRPRVLQSVEDPTFAGIPYCFRSKRKAQKEGTQQILFQQEKIWRFRRQSAELNAVNAYILSKSGLCAGAHALQRTATIRL